eukprot:5986112-Pyramimonas_sp.AAC.1
MDGAIENNLSMSQRGASAAALQRSNPTWQTDLAGVATAVKSLEEKGDYDAVRDLILDAPTRGCMWCEAH